MANEFIVRKGYIALEDSQITGSLSVTNAVTASFFTGSYRGDGSQLTGIEGFPFTGSAGITGSLTVVGPVNATTFTGDGSQLTGIEGFPFTGSAKITGSLEVTGSVSATSFIGNGSQLTGIDGFPFTGSAAISGSLIVVGPVNATSFTGSIQGTATTASYVQLANVDGFTAYSASINTTITPQTATVNTGSSPLTLTTQSIVIADSTNGNLIVNLPDLNTVVGTPNQKPIVVYKNDYSQNVIYVNPSGSQLVNGASQDIIVSIQLAVIYNPTSAGWVTEGTSAQSLAELELFFLSLTETGSLATTGSNVFIGNQIVTGSLTVTGNITGNITGSASTASYVEYANVANKPAIVSGSSQISFNGITDKPTLVSGSSQITYSGLTGIPSGILSGSAQIASFGIFATTGSNQFNGNQSITGSLTVSGQVVAQTLNVQQVTSSIVYSSGSNIFGNSLANTQQFTGSVLVTGSLAVAGAGTFTGTGLNASVRINNTTASTGKDWHLYSLNNGNFGLYNNTDGSYAYQVTPSGSLGLGVTPSAWNSAYRAIQFGTTGAIFGESGDAANYFTTNTFVDAVGFKYITSDFALGYFQENGVHSWRTAPSGTAGNAISFTQAMTLDASGRLGIGTTSPDSIFEVRGSTSSPQFRISRSEQTNQGLTIQAGGGVTVFNSYDGTDTVFGSYTFNSTKGSTTSTRMRIDGSGNVGIDSDSPANKLQVNVSSNVTSLYIDSSYPLMIKNTSTTDNSYVGMYFSTGLGVGATIQTLYTNASTRSEGNLLFSTRNSAGSLAERMRITSDGKVIVGASYMTYPVSIEAQSGGGQLALTRSGAVAEFYMGGTTGGGTQLYIRSGGSGGVRLDAGSTGWVADSDIRLKDIEKYIENAVESLSTLQTICYSWKNSDNKSLHLGLIAQEVEAVFPEIVSESSITGMKGVNYVELIPVLVKAIQEQQSQIEILKAEIQTLKQ